MNLPEEQYDHLIEELKNIKARLAAAEQEKEKLQDEVSTLQVKLQTIISYLQGLVNQGLGLQQAIDSLKDYMNYSTAYQSIDQLVNFIRSTLQHNIDAIEEKYNDIKQEVDNRFASSSFTLGKPFGIMLYRWHLSVINSLIDENKRIKNIFYYFSPNLSIWNYYKMFLGGNILTRFLVVANSLMLAVSLALGIYTIFYHITGTTAAYLAFKNAEIMLGNPAYMDLLHFYTMKAHVAMQLNWLDSLVAAVNSGQPNAVELVELQELKPAAIEMARLLYQDEAAKLDFLLIEKMSKINSNDVALFQKTLAHEFPKLNSYFPITDFSKAPDLGFVNKVLQLFTDMDHYEKNHLFPLNAQDREWVQIALNLKKKMATMAIKIKP